VIIICSSTAIVLAMSGFLVLSTRRPVDVRAYRRRRLTESLGLWSRFSIALYPLRYVFICAGAFDFAVGVSQMVRSLAPRVLLTASGVVLLVVGLKHTLEPPGDR